MNEGMWEDLLLRLEDKVGPLKVEKLSETRTDDIGQNIVSNIERIEFELGGNTLRVEKVTKPLILDKKTHYTHTAGARASVEYVLSEDETTTHIKAYRLDPDLDEWLEIGDAKSLSF